MKRRATGNIQKVEPKPKKGKRSKNDESDADGDGDRVEATWLNEENDAYRMKKGAYILTWHNVKPGNEYNQVFYKKEVTISSDSGRAKIKERSKLMIGRIWVKTMEIKVGIPNSIFIEPETEPKTCVWFKMTSTNPATPFNLTLLFTFEGRLYKYTPQM